MSLKSNKILFFSLILLIVGFFSLPLLIDRIVRARKTVNIRKILIIELWGIGDLVMMSAILQPLRSRFPHARICLLSKPQGKILFGTSGLIDKFIEFNFPWTQFTGKYRFWVWDWKGLLRTIRELRTEKFDIILNGRDDIRNNILSFLIGGKRRIGYDRTVGRWFLTDALSDTNNSMHRLDAWMSLLRYLELNTEDSRPFIPVTESQETVAESFLRRNGVKRGDLLIGIHPGAQIKVRCWPLARFAELAEYLRNKLGAKILVFAEPEGYGEDIPITGDFIKTKVSLEQMVGLIKKIDLLICNDSGAMHIATAVGTKSLAIFGPGDNKRIGPYGKGHTVIIEENVTCRPCFDRCRFKKTFCLDSISVARVQNIAERILSGALEKNALFQS